MKIAFIGTSHLSGLKLGWDLLPNDLKKNIYASFIGYPAPVFAKQIHEGWLIDNNEIYPTESGVKYFLEKISGDPNSPIRPLDYDVVCFVDLFFCYDYCLIYGSFNKVLYSSDKVPISDDCYKAILKNRIGKVHYNSHPVVDTVPEISVFPFIESIKQINPRLQLFLAPRPFSLNQKSDKFKWSWPSSKSILNAGNIFDNAASEKLNKYGVTYLPRTDQQTSFKSGLTDDVFSIGVLDDGITLDEHTNGQYGLLTINQLFTYL